MFPSKNIERAFEELRQMAEIEFRMLGALDVSRADGQQLHALLAQPKRVALLSYLCVARPRGFHRRDVLLGMFWPEADQSHARTSLRNALHVLRRTLGESVVEVRGDEEVAINFRSIACDVTAFDACVESGRVDEALALYRGDFLNGFFLEDVPDFERWLEAERARLKGLAARAARIAAEVREKERKITDAISLARRAAELTDNDERAVRKLVELLGRIGDRAGALQAYEKFRTFLREELDVEPDSETRALVERIRASSESIHPPAFASAPRPPTSLSTLPGYTVEGVLGQGGMATVLLAHDLKHDRKVAIKVMKPEIAALLGTERFLAEIGIAAKLSHPNIVPVHDSGEHEGTVYYVMPQVEGETLRSRLNRDGSIPLADAIRIVTRLGSALDYAHRRGVIHRDIKPENIMLCEGEPLLLDFGIAKAISAAGGSNLTQTGFTIGTPAYLSPEQASGETRLDGRTDQYSLACTFYEMVTGSAPFNATTPQRVIGMRFASKPPRLKRGTQGISASVASAVAKALAFDPSERFTTLQEFSDALARNRPPLHDVLRSSVSRPAVIATAAALVSILAFTVWKPRATQTVSESPFALTDKAQVTNTGRAMHAALSPNGKTLAFVDVKCTERACSYGVDLKDVDGASSRRILDSIVELSSAGIEWSPDGRNILLRGRVNNESGTVLVSALGNVVRRVGKERYYFWSGGDSLVFLRPDSASVHLLFSGLDGTPSDSVVAHVESVHPMSQVIPFPNSRWFAVRIPGRDGALWFSIDRRGRIVSRLHRINTVFGRASSDALWIATPDQSSDLISIVRVPFDSATGQFGARSDTLYTGSLNSMDVTPDGRSIIVNETTNEFIGWALDTKDLMNGVFPTKAPKMTATTDLRFEISPDGKWILVARRGGSSATGSRRWEVIPFSGGEPVSIPGSPPSDVVWADSSYISVWTPTQGGIKLAELNVETGTRKNEYLLTDSAWIAAVPLAGGGWAWNSQHSAVKVFRPNERGVVTITTSKISSAIRSLSASSDGRSLVFVGRRGSADSIRVVMISLTSGTVTEVKSIQGGGAALSAWLADGSILVGTSGNPDGGVRNYRISTGGKILSSWIIPVRAWGESFSADLKRATLVVRNYHGDVMMSRVARR